LVEYVSPLGAVTAELTVIESPAVALPTELLAVTV
jgi:hypothetical protein